MALRIRENRFRLAQDATAAALAEARHVLHLDPAVRHLEAEMLDAAAQLARRRNGALGGLVIVGHVELVAVRRAEHREAVGPLQLILAEAAERLESGQAEDLDAVIVPLGHHRQVVDDQDAVRPRQLAGAAALAAGAAQQLAGLRVVDDQLVGRLGGRRP